MTSIADLGRPVPLPAVPDPRRIVLFGTFDERRHPRVRVLREGLEARGHDVAVVNVPLDLDTAARVQLVTQPWRAPIVALRLGLAWARLLVRSRSVRRPDAVVVGYLGHFDVHLARFRWPRAHLVLDHMVSLADTTADRKLDSSRLLTRALAAVDRAATGRADTVVVDTVDQADQLPFDHRGKAVVVPVGAPSAWFAEGDAAPDGPAGAPLSVVFFGLYTPLQGATTIGEAIAKLAGEPVTWTMIGSGQDRAACAAAAGPAAVRWLDWVDADDLPAIVASHDVCLGIFGTGPKAQRVVPNKVFQGAAAGCVIVTSDTPSQRDALHEAAFFVPPGDAAALSEVIMNLTRQPSEVESRKRDAQTTARERFTPSAVVAALASRLGDTSTPETGDTTPAPPPLPPNAALRWHLVRRRVDEVAPTSILELGVGQGAVGARLATRATYVGLEPDATSRGIAESRLPSDARLVSDLGDLPAGETFDLACAFEVLEHIDDHAGVLRDWVTRVRPGGHVLVSVPAEPARFGPFDELVGHLRRYTSDDLAQLFTEVGLEVVAIDHYGFPLGNVLEAGRNVIGRRRLAAGSAPDDVAARTAGSGRNLQPARWAGPAIWAATAPFRLAQGRFPDRGPGLVGLARRPG